MAVMIEGNEIVLTGTVGEMWLEDDHFTHGDVIAALATVGHTQDVVVRLNSPGGIATEGSAIHAALARHKGKKTIVVEGIAASAASTLAMAGDDVVMSRGAIMMIHDPSGFTFGTAEEHERELRALHALGDAMASIYAEKSGRSVEQCRADMVEEIWLTGEQAVEMGYADRVGDAAAAEPVAFNYRAYRLAPERLVAIADARASSRRSGRQAAQSAATPRQQENPMPNDPADTVPANPNPLAPATAVAPATPPAPAPAPAAAANVVNLDDARAAGRAEAMAYVREVNEICALAGAPQKAQAFIDAHTNPGDVRKALLDERAAADEGRQVTSHILPTANTQPSGSAIVSRVVANYRGAVGGVPNRS